MSYGRLDVFWPDGKIESFNLAEQSVTIGRSAGSTIVLDTEVISRYHFNIISEDDKVYLVDLGSVNGTYMDGSRLNPEERYELDGGDEIQIGYLRMIYHALDDSPTTQLVSPLEDTQRVERETPDFRLELQPPPIAIAPGSYTSAELIIYNTGSAAQTYHVQVTGMPDGWARVNRPVLEIEPDDQATVVVNIKPLRRPDSAPGVYTAQVVVQRQDKPDAQMDIPFRVTILAYSGFGMALSGRRLGVRDSFQLHTHNQGSAPLPIHILGYSQDEQLQFVITPPQVTLAPGQRMQIRGEVRPAQKRLFGSAREYAFDVVVKSLELPHFTAATQGYFIEKPPFALWMSFAMLGVLVIAVALVLWGVLGLSNQARNPVIDEFVVNEGISQLPQGEPLRLRWQVTNAGLVSVRINDTLVLVDKLSEFLQNTELPTGDFSGTVDVTLLAYNNGDNRVATQTRQITIYNPVTINTFTLSPQPVVRNVVQTLTLTFDVPGATTVNFDGLAALSEAPITIPAGNNGSVAFTTIPQNDFSITLIAAADQREPVQQTLNIVLVDPQCMPVGANATLFSAPDSTSNVVSTVPQGTSIVVNGRNTAGDWLRTTLANAGVDVWGRRTDFTCATTFNVEDLRQIVANPTVTTTLAPPLTVVPTLAATPTVNPTGN